MGAKNLKKYFPTSAAIFLLFGITGLFLGFPGRHLATDISPFLLGYIGLIFAFVVANFLLTGMTDPGTIPKRENPEDDEDELRAPVYITVLIHDISVRMKWCATCNFYRPPRVSHCSVCNSCIEKFDHHCPWVNNCIGRRNYRYFFWFLMLLSVHMVNVFSFSLWAMILTKDVESAKEIFGASIAVMVADGLLFIPVFGLFAFHISLVTRGRTTNEQVTGKFGSGVNPFNDGCGQNCFNALCLPQLPKFIGRNDMVDYTKYAITPPYRSDHAIISVHDVNIAEGIKSSNQAKMDSPNSQNKVSLHQRKFNDTGNGETTVSSNVPEVKVVTRDGSIRQELDPNRFRAKVTPVQTQQICQPADAIAYACTDGRTDDISDTEQQQIEMSFLHDDTTNESLEGHNSSVTKLMTRNGHSIPHQDSNNIAESKLQSSESAEAESSSCMVDVHELMVPNRDDNSLSKAVGNSLEDLSSDPESSQHNASTYVRHPSPLGSKHNDPFCNANNCNNTSLDSNHIQSLSEVPVCESGYASTEHQLRNEDISNKIELENSMRDIEANVALLQVVESDERLKMETIMTSQTASKIPEEKLPLLLS